MGKRESTVTEMLDMYKTNWESFYMPYVDREDVEAVYKWRKEILKKLEEELDKQYTACYNKV